MSHPADSVASRGRYRQVTPTRRRVASSSETPFRLQVVTALPPEGEPLIADDAQRDAVVALVRDSLVTLLEHVERWVPDTARIETGDQLAIRLSWDYGDVDAEVLRLRYEAQQAEQQARINLTRLAKQ